MAAAEYSESCRHGQDDLLIFKLSIRMGKNLYMTLNVALFLDWSEYFRSC